MNVLQSLHPFARFEASLTRLGFTAAEGDYVRECVSLVLGRNWLTLTSPAPQALPRPAWPSDEEGLRVTDSRVTDRDGLAPRRRGLWKPTGKNGSAKLALHLPSNLLTRDFFDSHEEANEISPLEVALPWALATLDDRLPPRWEPPTPAVLGALVPASRRALQNGGIVRQIEIIATPERLTLQVPIVTELPVDLAEERRRWLNLLLEDIERLWPLVRTNFDLDGPQEIVVAEVDLSGVPEPLAEPLILAGLDSLRWAVERLAETADLLIHPAISWEALSVCNNQETKEEKTHESNSD